MTTVSNSSPLEEYAMTTFNPLYRMIRIKHSIHKPEGPINLLIHKDILKNATKEIIWIKNGDGRYIRISPNDYSSPECWSDINQALKNIHNG